MCAIARTAGNSSHTAAADSTRSLGVAAVVRSKAAARNKVADNSRQPEEAAAETAP